MRSHGPASQSDRYARRILPMSGKSDVWKTGEYLGRVAALRNALGDSQADRVHSLTPALRPRVTMLAHGRPFFWPKLDRRLLSLTKF